MPTFSLVAGTGAVLCYALVIIFDNAGLGALAIGLTMYGIAIQGGII